MKRYFLATLAVIVAITFVRLSFYTVDAAEYVYVTVLGQHCGTYDGAAKEDGAGLKFGWPWPIQQVRRLDRRLQHFDLPETDQLTHEKKTVDKLLSIKAYVCWKISDPDRFVESIGSADGARKILEPLIISRLGAAIGAMRMDDFVSTAEDADSGKKKVDITVEILRNKLLDELQGKARERYGIDVIDVRLRRFNHPASVRESIFQRIRSERNTEAKKYVSEGERLASDIAAQTDEEIRVALAEARSKEAAIKSAADTDAMKIRNQAYSQDPVFYDFLKQMETLQSILGGDRAMLLLSTHRPMFERMFAPPRPKTDASKEKK
ncbi:MAG: protease modulator HflC [Gemmataceae bacterium]|nr:protease modulator HflC [Gemmataceae bacterium]